MRRRMAVRPINIGRPVTSISSWSHCGRGEVHHLEPGSPSEFVWSTRYKEQELSPPTSEYSLTTLRLTSSFPITMRVSSLFVVCAALCAAVVALPIVSEGSSRHLRNNDVEHLVTSLIRRT